jgi:hypothetical protein
MKGPRGETHPEAEWWTNSDLGKYLRVCQLPAAELAAAVGGERFAELVDELGVQGQVGGRVLEPVLDGEGIAPP